MSQDDFHRYPDRYIPKQLRPQPPKKQDPSAPPLYGIGIAMREGTEMGMIAGPNPHLEEFLEMVPDDKEVAQGTVTIVEFRGDDSKDIYRWLPKERCWSRIVYRGG